MTSGAFKNGLLNLKHVNCPRNEFNLLNYNLTIRCQKKTILLNIKCNIECSIDFMSRNICLEKYVVTFCYVVIVGIRKIRIWRDN